MSKRGQPLFQPVRHLVSRITSHPGASRLTALFLLITVVLVALSVGYVIGTRDTQTDAAVMRQGTASALSAHIASQDDLCNTIERSELERALSQEKALSQVLNESLEAQQNALLQQQSEMNSLEDRILSALMKNYESQLISRSSGTVDNYRQEAEELIDLKKRLNQFEASEDAAEVDLADYRQSLDNRLDRIPTRWPVYGRISSGFGNRTHPVYRRPDFHPAIDIVADRGTSIRATATGYVAEASSDSSRGRYLIIDHGNGFKTVFMHCSSLKVSSGQTVEKGQVIATVGSTGTSTGPHLHYEIHLYGQPVNPVRFILE